MIGLLITDVDGRIVSSRNLPHGWGGQRGTRIHSFLHPDDFHDRQLRALAAGRVDRLHLECRIVASDGEVRHGLCFGARVPDDPQLLLFAVEDITRLRVRAELSADRGAPPAATGAHRRLEHDRWLRYAVAAGVERGLATGVLRVHVPDLAAAEPGGEGVLLRDIAHRLAGALTATTTVARVGRADFSIVLSGLTDPDAQAPLAAERVRAALAGIRAPLIGWAATAPGQSLHVSELVRRSVISMYEDRPGGGWRSTAAGAALWRLLRVAAAR